MHPRIEMSLALAEIEIREYVLSTYGLETAVAESPEEDFKDEVVSAVADRFRHLYAEDLKDILGWVLYDLIEEYYGY